MKHSPTLEYKGLTIVLSNPSRFDNHAKKLLSGTGGLFFTNDCLYPRGINRFQCDIRSLDECTSANPFLPNTHCILTLGAPALRILGNTDTELNAQRGSPIFSRADGIPVIASYSPQEAVDRKAYEAEFNPLIKEQQIIDDERESNNPVAEKRRHGKTNQKNFKFWLSKDVEKAVNIATNENNCVMAATNPGFNIYSNSPDIIQLLSSYKGRNLYFDMETDVALNITCFSFGFDLDSIFVVPVIDYNYHHAYTNLPNIFRALSAAIKSNRLVCHNGAGFDYLVLGYKYKLPIYKVYDTMVSQNRIFPGVEKSLGHCISLPWMMEPYHKDEGNFSYGNKQQAMQLWQYCGKDVSTMIKLHEVQTQYAKRKIGLTESIAAVNSYIPAYTLITLQGMRYDKEKVEEIWKYNDRMMLQLLRMLEILIGKAFLKKIRGVGKSPMPNSSLQCCRYFHDTLKYPVIAYTKTKKPKLDAKSIFKLKLKFNNPTLDIVIKYRQLLKESGSLKFVAWKE